MLHNQALDVFLQQQGNKLDVNLHMNVLDTSDHGTVMLVVLCCLCSMYSRDETLPQDSALRTSIIATVTVQAERLLF